MFQMMGEEEVITKEQGESESREGEEKRPEDPKTHIRQARKGFLLIGKREENPPAPA